VKTFVTVGNAKQPFTRLLEAVVANAPLLPQPVLVQHGHTPSPAGSLETVAFIGMEAFADRVREADLLIMHAGAGAMIHAITAGKRPIVMPRLAAFGEHVNDPQVEFAEAMSAAGKAWLAKDADELRRAIECALMERTSGPLASSTPPIIARIQAVLKELSLGEER